jgi:flagellar protein FliJ
MSGSSNARRAAGGRDRGLHAVARVRAVRERDSRAGLMQALRNVSTREAELAERRQALATASARPSGALGELAITRQFLEATAHAVVEAERRLAASATVATEARHRWQADKTRVRAIEQLLEARAERARADAQRAEARETDDIVGGRRAGRPAGADAQHEGGHA